MGSIKEITFLDHACIRKNSAGIISTSIFSSVLFPLVARKYIVNRVGKKGRFRIGLVSSIDPIESIKSFDVMSSLPKEIHENIKDVAVKESGLGAFKYECTEEDLGMNVDLMTPEKFIVYLAAVLNFFVTIAPPTYAHRNPRSRSLDPDNIINMVSNGSIPTLLRILLNTASRTPEANLLEIAHGISKDHRRPILHNIHKEIAKAARGRNDILFGNNDIGRTEQDRDRRLVWKLGIEIILLHSYCVWCENQGVPQNGSVIGSFHNTVSKVDADIFSKAAAGTQSKIRNALSERGLL